MTDSTLLHDLKDIRWYIINLRNKYDQWAGRFDIALKDVDFSIDVIENKKDRTITDHLAAAHEHIYFVYEHVLAPDLLELENKLTWLWNAAIKRK